MTEPSIADESAQRSVNLAESYRRQAVVNAETVVRQNTRIVALLADIAALTAELDRAYKQRNDVLDSVAEAQTALATARARRKTDVAAVQLIADNWKARAERAERCLIEGRSRLVEALTDRNHNANQAANAEAALARVKAYAAQHADWCCSKGCTAPEDPCDETCNCESGAILAAIDATEPPPGTGHRAGPHTEADTAFAPARALLNNLRTAVEEATDG